MKTAQQQRHYALQRHHIELTIIILSGIRLCYSVASSSASGSVVAATAFALVCSLALLLESAASRFGSPYKLRASASDGIAQGVLAVPSVLAALVTAAPEGGWVPWLHGSCAAAVGILGTICFESVMLRSPRSAAASFNIYDIKCSAPVQHTKQAALHSKDRCHGGDHEARREGAQPAGPPRTLSVMLGVVAPCLLSLLAITFLSQGYLTATCFKQLDAWQQWLQPPVRAAMQLAAWVCVSVSSFCLSLQLLPGCFSLGEASLLAQGVTSLLVTAAHSAPTALLFVPPAVCQCLPPSVNQGMVQLGACTPQAHSAALSCRNLPAVISLVLCAAMGACLMLRVLWDAMQQLQDNWVRQLKSSPGHAHKLRQQVRSHQHITAARSHPQAPAVRPSAKAVVTIEGRTDRKSWQTARVTAQMQLHAAAALAAACTICGLLAWLGCAAIWTLMEFLPAGHGRLGVLLYWVSLLAATLPALKWLAKAGSMPQIIVRKVYHLLAMGLFVPVFFWDLQLLSLSLAIAFAALVLLEVLRCIRIPLIGQAVQNFMQAFVDERDAGVIYITHFTLLLGLAVPMWLSLVLPGASLVTPHAQSPPNPYCAANDTACTSVIHGQAPGQLAVLLASLWQRSVILAGTDPARILVQVTAGLSGLVIIGVGDTAASFIGKLFGRVPVHIGSNKTVEGTAAGITASLGAWMLLLWCSQLLPALSGLHAVAWWAQLVLATVGAGLMEAATSQLDNILLPLWYFPHLLLV